MRGAGRGLAAAILVWLAGAGLGRAADPIELWTDGTLAFGGREIGGETAAEVRLGEGGDIGLWNVQSSLLFHPHPGFAWGPGLKFERQRPADGSFLDERRFLLSGRWRSTRDTGARPDVRVQLEYRGREGRPRSWRLRLRPAVTMGPGQSAWTLNVSDEAFYDFETGTVAQNRLRIGPERRLTSTVGLLVYYMWVADHVDSCWETTHVVGTSWRFGVRTPTRGMAH